MEDFRVEVVCEDESHAAALYDRLRGHSPDVSGLAGVMVSRDGRNVFLYAETEEQAHSAAGVVESIAGSASILVTRWHPIEEEWKDVAIGLPATPEEEAAEMAAREEAEAAEAAAEGDYDWHVVVHLPRHDEAEALERTLSGEGLAVKRRWRYVVAGVLTEERAEELARRLEADLPEGSDVRIEANLSDVERSPLQFLPF